MNRDPAIDSTKAPLARLAEWRGTERYRVRRCIGTGAVGAVYEAFDAEREAVVALKKLRHFSPATLYLFKQEFRTLADVHHPNLVRLYELFATEDRDVFFTMELVHGVDLVAYVRPEGVLDVDRLRPAMRQLVEGVEAIHAAGKLHRDIKPSNVMMTAEGRAVLLDFGVAIELARAGDEDLEAEQPIVGTASYMAPEQASGAPLSPASDWYGVGAVLFEALVGSPPFLGSVADVLKMKRQVAASLPSACAEGLPPDLDALCGALMNRAADEASDGTGDSDAPRRESPRRRRNLPDGGRRTEQHGEARRPARAAPGNCERHSRRCVRGTRSPSGCTALREWASRRWAKSSSTV